MAVKVKKSILKRLWFGVSIVAVISLGGGVLTGCSTSKESATSTSTSQTANKEADKTSENQTKTFKVGDTVELKDFKVTVNKVYNVKGDDFSKPKEGNEFIAVDCTLENISKKSQAVSSMLMFKVVDSEGRAAEYSLEGLMAAKAGQLDGEISPGRKLTGAYVVEVPKGTKGLELEFDSSFLASGQVIVKLN